MVQNFAADAPTAMGRLKKEISDDRQPPAEFDVKTIRENDNTEARALYKKFGFQASDRIPMSKRIKPL